VLATTPHVELQLKSLLAQLRALSDLPSENRHHHRIDQLWQETRKLLLKHFPGDSTDLATVGKVIEQLSGLDPVGEAFCYDTSRDGRMTLADVDRINLLALHEAMVGVANYLDAADTGTNEYLSSKREIDTYYAAEFGPAWSDFG
jgi:hypothetical protein